jgi:hypothetical protein
MDDARAIELLRRAIEHRAASVRALRKGHMAAARYLAIWDTCGPRVDLEEEERAIERAKDALQRRDQEARYRRGL